MGHPEPVTPPEEDFFGRRAQCVGDLEKTLVRFFKNLFVGARLDNPTLNLGQPEVIPFDPVQRAQALDLKVAPQIVRGRIPRSVTGEIDPDKLPDYPAIMIQAIAAHVAKDETIVNVRILFGAYDENPDNAGYQDVQNMMETAAIALTSFGQAAIDHAYPIVMPLDWKLIEADTFPHFIGEMTTQFELPSGRPMPDQEVFGIVPAEHLEMKVSAETQTPEVLFE